MRQRSISEICVDQRDNRTNARDAQPDRHIFGSVRHEQANDITFGEPFECPTAVAIRLMCQLRVCESPAVREQSPVLSMRRTKLVDPVREQATWIARNGRSCLKCANPRVAASTIFRGF